MKDKLRIQIIGWLLLIVSILVAGSMIGYDLTEEPSLLAQKINNPFNILGVYVGFYLMKLGFGYAALLFPVILATVSYLSLIHISEPRGQGATRMAAFALKKKKEAR